MWSVFGVQAAERGLSAPFKILVKADDGKCAWTGELVRPPRTEAHFEALRKRIDSLEAYSTLLESIVDKCRDEHGAEHVHYLDLRPVNEFEVDITEDNDDATQDLVVTTENLKVCCLYCCLHLDS